MRVVVSTALALLAFAGNSILCRLALGEEAIDAASFTVIRLLSGIIVLALALKLTRVATDTEPPKGSWKASFMLFLYALTFSYAYVTLDTGTGALVLFGAVQITMIATGLFAGHRLGYPESLGVLTAFGGLVYLVLPGLSTPSLLGFVLMSLSGIAWGFYTLAGQGSKNPLSDTAYNFLRTLPLVILVFIISYPQAHLSPKGVLLAVVSGGLASGLGYALWYTALGGLTAIQAAVVQLLVPVIAAVGGVLFANELFSMRLGLSSVLILGGIMIVIFAKYFSEQRAKIQ